MEIYVYILNAVLLLAAGAQANDSGDVPLIGAIWLGVLPLSGRILGWW